MNEWKAITAGISLFPIMAPPRPQVSARDLFKRIWGREPNNFQSQMNSLIPTSAQGIQGALAFNCISQPTRIDFTLTPAPTSGQPPKVALIDDANVLRQELERIIESIGKDAELNYIWRVALNLHFIRVLPGVGEANRELMGVIPRKYGVTVTDEDDFVFQINRPYNALASQNTRLNIITKWSVERVQVISVAVPVSGMPLGTETALPFPQIATFIAASVHFDNNNVPVQNRAFNGTDQAALLREALQKTQEMQREIGLNTGGF